MKTHTLAFWINLAGFQLLWPAAVLGAASGTPHLAWVVLFVMCALMFIAGADWKRDVCMLVAGFLACLLLEPLWLVSGSITYVDWTSRWLAPGWIWALWGGFAVSFFYCLAWLQTRPLIAMAFGGIGGAVSVLMGIRLGAAQAPSGEWQLMVLYGSVWAMVVPLFAALARWRDKPDNKWVRDGIRDHG
ncbi:DUF2878 domain-containing protein [Alcanivorax sp. S6407]|uniref:DUF2878 domain-containing protein n=1 Tax=Alcanivorax sp. S6407 TaxID=2926424 RepID=UPI001FF56698|nr:DUF2878 domain-containing protein [Alcanivorax sp. S6407]MCK0153020.1 DUF2878 domain-containing protein [Alcanivorax sp. S6407]